MTSSQNDPSVYTSNPQDPRTSAITPVCTSWERGRPVRKVLEWTGPWHVWALAALAGLAAMSGWTRLALTRTRRAMNNNQGTLAYPTERDTEGSREV